MVNNWEASKWLDSFVKEYLDPSTKKTLEARNIIEDPNYKWKKGEKDRAKAKWLKIEGENIFLHSFVNSVRGLIDDHEAQTDMLTEVYAEWWNKIAYDGVQPLEIMKVQQQIIMRIWARIYEALEPLELNLSPPKQIEKL